MSCKQTYHSVIAKQSLKLFSIPPRLGVQIGFVQKQLVSTTPLRAISSMCGVLFIREPYAPIACAAWSSDMI